MKSLNKDKKIILLCLFIPLLFVAQYYVFKVGVISPMIKGVNIEIIEGEYIQDIDKYVVKLGDDVVLSAGDYIKIPQYAKDPKIKFSILDNSKTIKLKDNYKNAGFKSFASTGDIYQLFYEQLQGLFLLLFHLLNIFLRLVYLLASSFQMFLF